MDFLKFAQTVGKLKNIKRTGWVKHHIPDPESVADHIFRTITLAMFLAKNAGVDQDKVVKMAIVHYLVEGAKTVTDPVIKSNNERKVLQEVLSIINAKEYSALFGEFEENKTPEAKFLKQLDKLETAIQALEHEQSYLTAAIPLIV